MKNFQKQLWFSISIVIVAVAAAAVGIYLISGQMTATAQKIVTDKNLIAAQSASVGILATLEGEAPKAAAYVTAMQTLLPTHEALIGLSPWLTGIAQKHNVTVSFSFTGTKTAATASTPGIDAFSLGVDGAPADIAAFLEDIEYQAPGFLLSIDSFTLANQGNSYHLSAQGEAFSRQ
jgi:hypothetical protein